MTRHSPSPTGEPAKGSVSPPDGGGETEKIARRNFFIEGVSFVIGTLIVAVPAAVATAFFFNPLLRKSKSATDENARRDSDGYLRVTSLASLPADGRPQIFTVYDDVVDAWNKFVDQPVGR